jgi:hypothetical protein
MNKNNAQFIVDELFLEGEIDYHFFFEFFEIVSFVENERKKENSVCFEEALRLSKFFIDSGFYAGFYMHKNHESFYCRYDNFLEYEELVRYKNSIIPCYAVAGLNSDGFSIGVVKIVDGAKAPKVTLEIEQIFNVY